MNPICTNETYHSLDSRHRIGAAAVRRKEYSMESASSHGYLKTNLKMPGCSRKEFVSTFDYSVFQVAATRLQERYYGLTEFKITRNARTALFRNSGIPPPQPTGTQVHKKPYGRKPSACSSRMENYHPGTGRSQVRLPTALAVGGPRSPPLYGKVKRAVR